jgi:hypothetical protein
MPNDGMSHGGLNVRQRFIRLLGIAVAQPNLRGSPLPSRERGWGRGGGGAGKANVARVARPLSPTLSREGRGSQMPFARLATRGWPTRFKGYIAFNPGAPMRTGTHSDI